METPKTILRGIKSACHLQKFICVYFGVQVLYQKSLPLSPCSQKWHKPQIRKQSRHTRNTPQTETPDTQVKYSTHTHIHTQTHTDTHRHTHNPDRETHKHPRHKSHILQTTTHTYTHTLTHTNTHTGHTHTPDTWHPSWFPGNQNYLAFETKEIFHKSLGAGLKSDKGRGLGLLGVFWGLGIESQVFWGFISGIFRFLLTTICAWE